MLANKASKNDLEVQTEATSEGLVDYPAYNSMDLDNARFMDHLRQAFSTQFTPELDAWIGKDKE
jgi:hypothetical protein